MNPNTPKVTMALEFGVICGIICSAISLHELKVYWRENEAHNNGKFDLYNFRFQGISVSTYSGRMAND